MSGLQTLRSRIVEGPDSLGEHRRSKRWEILLRTFPDLNSMSIIDLGGTVEMWERAPVRPAALHVVNLETPPFDIPGWVRVDQADACDLPERITSGNYDLAFSNSVIEHVGGHVQRMRFAEQVHRLASRHWVQTPYRYFPVEPHLLFPGFQFLPLPAQALVSQYWPLARPVIGRQENLRWVMGLELQCRAAMATYFPKSKLIYERMLGLIKSLIVVKTE